MFNQIQEMLANNQVFSGGAVLMLLGGAAAYLRNAPKLIFSRLKLFFIYSVTIDERDELYDGCVSWLAKHNYTRTKARSFFATSKTATEEPSYCETGDEIFTDLRSRPEVLLTPSDGTHWFFYHGTIVWISRKTDRQMDSRNQQASTITIEVLGYNRSVAVSLLNQIADNKWPVEEGQVRFYKCQHYHDGSCRWSPFASTQERPVSSVILKSGLMESLCADILRFRKMRDWYKQRFIPYHRGFLLYGPPGTGKTSTIVALATHFKMKIVWLHLSDDKMTDSSLMSAMAQLPANSIVMLEDIDSLFDEERKAKNRGGVTGGVTFSGLLNVLDGLTSSRGRIVVSTTNHLERIDPALLRSGRFDVKVFLGHPDADQVCRMIQKFFPDHRDDDRIELCASQLAAKDISAAAVQEYLMSRIDNFQSVLDDVELASEQDAARLAMHVVPGLDKDE